jgi:hypothetical protein
MMKGMRNCYLRLCFAGLGMILGLTGCNYKDGPVLSLRSRGDRMDFTRPMTYYENNGIDSTAALNQRFEDSISNFEGQFVFRWEPDQEINFIVSSENRFATETIGFWFIDGFDDFERIFIYGIPGQTWPALNAWTITRLTHRKLWLEGPGGRLLRFEE